MAVFGGADGAERLGVELVEVVGDGCDVGFGDVVAAAERAGVVDLEEAPHERLALGEVLVGCEGVGGF